MTIVPGLLFRLFRKNQAGIEANTEKFLEVYERLNDRDREHSLKELQDEVIQRLDKRFESYIRKCKDEDFLSDISYLLSMFQLPLSAYQKVRSRTMLAELLKQHSSSNEKKEILAYIIDYLGAQY